MSWRLKLHSYAVVSEPIARATIRRLLSPQVMHALYHMYRFGAHLVVCNSWPIALSGMYTWFLCKVMHQILILLNGHWKNWIRCCLSVLFLCVRSEQPAAAGDVGSMVARGCVCCALHMQYLLAQRLLHVVLLSVCTALTG